MKTLNSIVSLLIIAGVLFVIAGCTKPEGYGKPFTGRETVPVAEILKAPDAYNGKLVAVQGTIASECPTGCWFMLEDKTGEIYDDLNPAGFALPQHVGKLVTTEGVVKVRGAQVMIIGEAVKIQ